MSDTLSYILKTSVNQTFGAMAGFLQKAADHAVSTEVDEAVFLAYRLAPDMFPLSRQVQIATAIALRGSSRLAGVDAIELEDTETSFAELIARCQHASDIIEKFDDDTINGNERVAMEIPLGPMTVNWEGREYASLFLLPNLHFHAATAYGLLRAQGVKLGKRDFLMPG